MTGALYTTRQVADLLGLHVKTVRAYIRDGRLKSTRIGKQYRIAEADLERFSGSNVQPGRTRMKPSSEASCIVQVDALPEDDADRLTNLLIAAAKGHREEQRLKIETLYDPEWNRLKVIVIGSVESTVAILQMVDRLTGVQVP